MSLDPNQEQLGVPSSWPSPAPQQLETQPQVQAGGRQSGRRPASRRQLPSSAQVSPPAPVQQTSFSQVPTRAQLQQYQSLVKDAKGRPRLPPSVMQALDFARDSPEGAPHNIVSEILEVGIQTVWDKVLDIYEESEQKEVYLMSDDEYMLFNYWQYRFEDNDIAVKVRARFWSGK
ncbi:hypothetical protein QBC43DRAFT_352552 [Cladorrhinum sp. PSN259]|nr:hypothetical protein QBC43DRAFT_352552 [Cladorrhinum sp. PSN259]